MIMHTIVSNDVIYEGIEGMKAPEETVYEGVIMQIERLDDGRAKIVRLISGNPADYLKPHLAPGQFISLWPHM